MRYKIFAIRDRATDMFAQPFYAQTTGAAVRMFSDEVNRADQNNNLFKHSEDFDLYEFGEFDDSTGMFVTTVPSQVAVGKDVSTKVRL